VERVTDMELSGLNIKFYLNDKYVEVTVTPETTALNLIREQLLHTGAKEVCAEGDCGACTIALGQWRNKQFSYQAINSCLLPAARLHGSHVITVEGLAAGDKLHVIQQQMLEHHAVQCGYCTAGMVMALFCLLTNNPTPNLEDIYAALEGNLCRCTGYVAIRKAAMALSSLLQNSISVTSQLNFLPAFAEHIKNDIQNIPPIVYVSLQKTAADICEAYYLPTTIAELFACMNQHKTKFKIMNGGTDLMVPANLQGIFPECFIDISSIDALNHISKTNGEIIIGAGVKLNEILHNELIQQDLPILAQAISLMASNQIRNIATLAGNIVNASPIADTACVLLALDASVTLLSKAGERQVKLADFYHDYKVIELKKDTEIISKVAIIPESGMCSFEKTSKRSALDIATVNSAIFMQKANNDIVTKCRIAFGGVAKTPVLAKNSASYLIGNKITPEVIAKVAKLAAEEFQPIADVRGSAEYRKILIHNHILKHLKKAITNG
jgi:xanthine dehydrogenase small subunit